VAQVLGPQHELVSIAIASARELRDRTNFNSHAGALLDKGLRLAGEREMHRLLVLGPGQMGRLVAMRGLELGFDEVVLAGRQLPDSRSAGVVPWTLDRLHELGPFTCIAGCLGSGADEIATDALPPAPIVLDLGTPRNFALTDRRMLITLAELMADEEARPHAVRRRAALRDELGEIVGRRLDDWQTTGASAIGAIRQSADVVRQNEVERALRLHPDLDPKVADALARSIINQLLDPPTRKLREDPELARTVADLFARTEAGPREGPAR
jgi:glutamyl-tRNA reductase